MEKVNPSFLSDDEIDLRILIKSLINEIQTNKLLISALVIFGVSIGGLIFYLLPPVYESKMVCVSSYLPGNDAIELVNSCKILIKNKDYKALNKKTGLGKDELTKIKNIEAEVVPNDNSNIVVRSFSIEISVSNTNSLEKIQNGLISYLQKSSSENTSMKRRNFILMKKKINSELAGLDSVKNSIKKLFDKGGNSSNPFISDPGSINMQIVSLYERSLFIDEEIEKLDKIKILEGFAIPEKPSNPKLLICLGGGFLIGVFASIVILFFRNLFSND